MELLSADPFDIEAQAKIAERIRQQQVHSCPAFGSCFFCRDWLRACQLSDLLIVHSPNVLSFSVKKSLQA